MLYTIGITDSSQRLRGDSARIWLHFVAMEHNRERLHGRTSPKFVNATTTSNCTYLSFL